MAKRFSPRDDSELDAEFNWLLHTIQRELERAIQEGFALGSDPHVAYSISIERSVPRRKKIPKAEKQAADVFWELVEQRDSVVLLLQFNFDPLDVSFSLGKKELRVLIQSLYKKQTRKIPFRYSVVFEKKQIRCKNGIMEVVFPKKKLIKN